MSWSMYSRGNKPAVLASIALLTAPPGQEAPFEAAKSYVVSQVEAIPDVCEFKPDAVYDVDVSASGHTDEYGTFANISVTARAVDPPVSTPEPEVESAPDPGSEGPAVEAEPASGLEPGTDYGDSEETPMVDGGEVGPVPADDAA